MDAEPNTAVSPPNAAASPLGGLISYTHWIYALHSLSVLSALFTTRAVALRFAFGLPSIIAVIMNYARRSETRGTWLESHFRWQIRTFWYAWLWIIVSLIIAMPLVLLAGLGLDVFIVLIIVSIGGFFAAAEMALVSLREGRAMPLPAPEL